MKRHLLSLLPLLLAARMAPGAEAPAPASAGAVRVQVLVTEPDGGHDRPESAVVWIPGSTDPARRPARPPRLASKRKRFDPRVLAVPVGTTVEFPNFDRIFHNVFSLSSTATFDLGLYRNGDFKPYTFRTPGLVKVYCNIHPSMAAYVLVVDGDLLALTGGTGVAELTGVPPGRQTLRVWDEKGGDGTATADVVAGKTTNVTVTLDGSRFRETPHKNKYGRDYPPLEEDELRY